MDLAGIGDVNGDGHDDVIISAPNYDNSNTDAGAVFLYLGSAGGLSTEPAWQVEGSINNARFGTAVDGAGDVDDDGLADFIVTGYKGPPATR